MDTTDDILPPTPTVIGTELLQWLQTPDGEARMRDLWSDWTPATGDERDTALAIEATVRYDLMDALAAVTDETDQRIAVALWCVRARAAWGLLNLQTGYEANAGVWNLPAIYGLSALSNLLGVVEPLLPTAFRALMQDVWTQATLQATLPQTAAPAFRLSELPALLQAEAEEGDERDELRDRFYELQNALMERERERLILAAEVGTDPGDAVETARHKLRLYNTRLAEQSRELATLRMERDEIAGHLPGREPASDAAEKIRALTQTIRHLEGRLALREADRRAFEKELGTSDAEDILAHVQMLQSKESKLRNRVSLLQTNGLFLLRELGGGREEDAPGNDTDGWFWEATQQAHSLKETVGLRNAQLSELRAQWEGVLIEAGASEPVAVAAQIRSLRTQLRRMQADITEMLGANDFGIENVIALPPLPQSLGGA